MSNPDFERNVTRDPRGRFADKPRQGGTDDLSPCPSVDQCTGKSETTQYDATPVIRPRDIECAEHYRRALREWEDVGALTPDAQKQIVTSARGLARKLEPIIGPNAARTAAWESMLGCSRKYITAQEVAHAAARDGAFSTDHILQRFGLGGAYLRVGRQYDDRLDAHMSEDERNALWDTCATEDADHNIARGVDWKAARLSNGISTKTHTTGRTHNGEPPNGRIAYEPRKAHAIQRIAFVGDYAALP